MSCRSLRSSCSLSSCSSSCSLQRCPDTGPHARVAHAPRFCWKPRPPLPPGVNPEFMKAQRAKRTYRELRFVLDEYGEVVDRYPGAGGPTQREPRGVDGGAAGADVSASARSSPVAGSSLAPSPTAASTASRASRSPSLRHSSRGSFAKALHLQRRSVDSGGKEAEEEARRAARRRSSLFEELGEEEGEWQREPSPIFTRKEIVEGEPFKDRRLQQDFFEGPGEKPNELVEEKTRQALESDAERKPVDGRGELYEREEGTEPPMEAFEARRSKSRGAEEKREGSIHDEAREEGKQKKKTSIDERRREDTREDEIEGEGEEEEEDDEEEEEEEEGREKDEGRQKEGGGKVKEGAKYQEDEDGGGIEEERRKEEKEGIEDEGGIEDEEGKEEEEDDDMPFLDEEEEEVEEEEGGRGEGELEELD